MKEAVAILAGLLAIVGNVPYSVGVVKGRIKPHAYTWFVWSIVSGIVLVGQVQKGAGVGALPTLIAELFTFVNFGLAVRYGHTKPLKIDNIFLAVAILGLATWPLVHDPTIAVVIAVSVNLVAFLPTLRKTWTEPRSEGLGLYALNVIRHILAMFSLEAYNVATTLHSIVMVITNGLMCVFIARRPRTPSLKE